MLVTEGFYNKENWLRDTERSTSGLELFRKWFTKRKNDTPLSNVWHFDIGKLVIPIIFFDDDLLIMIAKRYDPMLRVVKNYVGENLFRVTPEVIREVFMLNPNHTLHDKIEMDDLQARYDAQMVYLQGGKLQENFVKIGHLPLVISHTPNPLLRKYYNRKEKEFYLSLCKLFGIPSFHCCPNITIWYEFHFLFCKISCRINS